METTDKIKHAIKLIKSANLTRTYTIAFSGGKDSVVLSYLAKEAGLKLPHVYNLTTIDPKGTTAFCKNYGCFIKRPEQTFLQLVEKKGLPTQFRRFCCQILKEQYIADYLMTGVRKSESVKRNKRYCSFEGVHKYSKNQQTTLLYPLIYFDNFDIEWIINEHELECHPLYYDNDGVFHVERRLGCQGCPLQGDRGRADFIANPKLLVAVAKRIIKFHENHGRSEKDAYLNLAYHLFYSNHGRQKYMQSFHGFFENDPKAILEQYFKIKMP